MAGWLRLADLVRTFVSASDYSSHSGPNVFFAFRISEGADMILGHDQNGPLSSLPQRLWQSYSIIKRFCATSLMAEILAVQDLKQFNDYTKRHPQHRHHRPR